MPLWVPRTRSPRRKCQNRILGPRVWLSASLPLRCGTWSSCAGHCDMCSMVHAANLLSTAHKERRSAYVCIPPPPTTLQPKLHSPPARSRCQFQCIALCFSMSKSTGYCWLDADGAGAVSNDSSVFNAGGFYADLVKRLAEQRDVLQQIATRSDVILSQRDGVKPAGWPAGSVQPARAWSAPVGPSYDTFIREATNSHA